MTDLSIFVAPVHTRVTLLLGDDLARIFHDYLIWGKATIGTNAIATIDSLDDFDANIEFSPCLVPFLKVSKATVGAAVFANIAIAVVALIKHETVVALLVTAGLERTVAD